jgi:hypothetical protein
MGFKCRLFGHTYGSPEVERSRKEEGDEVVVTVRNVKRCERCGDEKMVNQTKEVTAVRSPEEVGLDTAEGASATPDPAGGPDTEPDAPGEEESPVTPVESEPTPAAEPTPDPGGPVDATVDVDAEPTVESPDEFGDSGIEDGPEPQPEPVDAAGTDEEWDRDAVVEEPDVQPAEAAEEPDAQTDEGAEESSASESTDDGWETGSDDWDDVEPDPDVDDAVILDAGETERDEVQWPEESDADPETTEPPEPEASQTADDQPTNDAEIIDAAGPGADPVDGAADGWPDHEDTGAAGGWPEHEDADEGYSATPNGDIDAEFDGDGLTPEVNGGAPDDSAAVDGITVGGDAAEQTYVGTRADADAGSDAETGEGFVSAGESTTEDVPSDRVEFYCPNCGHARTAGASSIRAGDICPECKQGYIAERER